MMKENSRTSLILAGLPSVGKSTLTNNVMERIPSMRVSTDETRRQLARSGLRFLLKDEEWVYSECQRQIDDYFDNEDRLIIVDTTSIRKGSKGLTLVEAAEKAALRSHRRLLKLALVASAETLNIRRSKRLTPDSALMPQDQYLEALRSNTQYFSEGMPVGSGWSIIDTDNMDQAEVAERVVELINCRDSEPINDLESIWMQIDYDVIRGDVLDKWAYSARKDDSIDMGRWTRYASNEGVRNIYGHILKSTHPNLLERLFRHINGSVKDNNPYVPEYGTLLKNVTRFCLDIIGGKCDSEKHMVELHDLVVGQHFLSQYFSVCLDDKRTAYYRIDYERSSGLLINLLDVS